MRLSPTANDRRHGHGWLWPRLRRGGAGSGPSLPRAVGCGSGGFTCANAARLGMCCASAGAAQPPRRQAVVAARVGDMWPASTGCNYPVVSCTLLCVDGEESASRDAEFSELVQSRWPRLVRLAYGFTGDAGLAEDLVQSALASAYASWWRVRRAEDRDRYLTRILINAHRSSFRKRRVAESLSGMPASQVRYLAADPADAADDRGAVIRCAGGVAGPPARGRRAAVLAGPDRGPGRGAAGLQCGQRQEPGFQGWPGSG